MEVNRYLVHKRLIQWWIEKAIATLFVPWFLESSCHLKMLTKNDYLKFYVDFSANANRTNLKQMSSF